MKPPEPRAFVVAGAKPWNQRTFERELAAMPGNWSFVATPSELEQVLAERAPRYVFFLHWSHRVADAITDAHECVVFHMTDVPYGRGGTPLQNLIARGHRRSVLSAIRMTSEIDAGPVYAKHDIDLCGTAEEIYLRADAVAAEMIRHIVGSEPRPVPQDGEVTVFARRSPAESQVTAAGDLDQLHDFIRMLDADGYPAAFIDHGPFRIELRRAARYDGRVDADARIILRDAGA